jgi:hypothetical protein
MIRCVGVDLEISPIPLRRVVTRSSPRSNGWFASRKMRRAIPWSSSIEFAFLVLAELDPSISAIYAQAVRLEVEAVPGRRSYVPDFVVLRSGTVEVFEVKPNIYVESPANIHLLQAAELTLRRRGARFGVALATDLRSEPRYARARDILRWLHHPLPPGLAQRVAATAAVLNPCSVSALLEVHAGDDLTLQDVLALVATNHLQVELTEPVTLATNVTTGSREILPRANFGRPTHDAA